MNEAAELRRCVQALAQPAGVQLSLFPGFVVVGDELAIQFADALYAYRMSRPPTEPNQAESLEQLEHYLTKLSGTGEESFWLDRTAFASDVRWQRIRELARHVLAAFDWPDEPPPRDGSTYVSADGLVRNI